jgi:ABC-2 type transport system permease protein
MTATTSTSPGLRVWAVLVSSIATRARVIGLGTLGVGAIVLGLAIRLAHPADRAGAAWSLVDGYGLSLLIPVVALVFASAALGDPAEDGTLVYLWLRPLPRWQLAVAACAASLTLSIPLAVVPVIVAASVSGVGGRLILGAAAGALLASAAYTAVFVGLGLRVRRALAWGLAYLLIWEQAVARVAKGAARLSISVTSRTVDARLAGHDPLPRNAMSMPVAVVIPVVALLLAVAITARSLDHGEIA